MTERIGQNAPQVILGDLDNNSLSLSAIKGDVDSKPKGVIFWGISAEQPSALKKWLTQNQPGFTIIVDKEGDVTDDYRTEGIPALVVVGRDGRIRSFYSGAQSERSLRAAIDEALR